MFIPNSQFTHPAQSLPFNRSALPGDRVVSSRLVRALGLPLDDGKKQLLLGG